MAPSWESRCKYDKRKKEKGKFTCKNWMRESEAYSHHAAYNVAFNQPSLLQVVGYSKVTHI